MLGEKELSQVRDYVIKILPELLRAEPEIVSTIEGIIAQQFPRRDEFARLLDELQSQREENKLRFDQVDRRLDQVDRRLDHLQQEMDRRFELLQQEMNRRFELVDRRFEKSERTLLEVRRDVAKILAEQQSMIKRLCSRSIYFAGRQSRGAYSVYPVWIRIGGLN